MVTKLLTNQVLQKYIVFKPVSAAKIQHWLIDSAVASVFWDKIRVLNKRNPWYLTAAGFRLVLTAPHLSEWSPNLPDYRCGQKRRSASTVRALNNGLLCHFLNADLISRPWNPSLYLLFDSSQDFSQTFLQLTGLFIPASADPLAAALRLSDAIFSPLFRRLGAYF